MNITQSNTPVLTDERLEELRLIFEATFPELNKAKHPCGEYHRAATQFSWLGFQSGFSLAAQSQQWQPISTAVKDLQSKAHELIDKHEMYAAMCCDNGDKEQAEDHIQIARVLRLSVTIHESSMTEIESLRQRLAASEAERDGKERNLVLLRGKLKDCESALSSTEQENEKLKERYEVACNTISSMQNERQHRDSYGVLSGLSSFLGQGLGDASTSADDYDKRIRAGIEEHIRVQAQSLAQQAVEVLTFYANPEIYKPHPHGPAFDDRDLSFRAKAVLEALSSTTESADGKEVGR